jgi:hypothetical protein
MYGKIDFRYCKTFNYEKKNGKLLKIHRNVVKRRNSPVNGGSARFQSFSFPLQQLAADGFEDLAGEIGFFRGIWPRFYAKLFFYPLARRFE